MWSRPITFMNAVVAGPPPPSLASIQIIITDRSSIETGLRVEKSLSPFTVWQTAATYPPIITEGSSITRIISGFAFNTLHKVRSIAFNGAGDSTEDNSVLLYTRPADSPTGFTATVFSATQVNFTFVQPTVTPVSGGYQIRYSTDAGASWVLSDILIPTGSTTASLTGLAEDTSYRFQIRAVNINSGGDSTTRNAGADWTASVTAVTPPSVLTYSGTEYSIPGSVQVYQLNDTATVTATDDMGLFPGTYSGTYTQGVTGIPGSTGTAVTFTSGAAVVSGAGGNTSSLGTISASTRFTVSIWVKTTSNLISKIILQVGASSLDRGIVIRVSNTNGNRPMFRLLDNAGAILANTEVPVVYNDGNWHRLSVVWDGTSFIGYMDGVQVTSVPVTITTPIGTDRLRIAAKADASLGTSWWIGTADAVWIRNNANTAAQELMLYNRGMNP